MDERGMTALFDRFVPQNRLQFVFLLLVLVDRVCHERYEYGK